MYNVAFYGRRFAPPQMQALHDWDWGNPSPRVPWGREIVPFYWRRLQRSLQRRAASRAVPEPDRVPQAAMVTSRSAR